MRIRSLYASQACASPSPYARRRLCVWVLLACLGIATHAHAQNARTDFLIRKLQTSTHFRVRAQAALSLARVERSSESVRALIVALKDEHPAVRSSAAAALQEMRDCSALPALRRIARDPDPTVRSAVNQAISALEHTETQDQRGVFYVGVGSLGSNVQGIKGGSLQALRHFVKQRIATMAGVRLAPDNESEAQARSVLQKQSLVGYYVDSSIVNVEQSSDQEVRAEVSVILSTYPGHDIRAMLSGAARVSGGGDFATMRQQAIEGAFSGALKRLSQAMQQASGGR